MSETLGGLIDRLTITNIKLWFIQQNVMDWSKMPRDEFEKLGFEKLQKQFENLNHLNLDRNRLMAEIDSCLAEAVRSGQVRVDARVKLTE